ncbi:PREDICTED: renin receptor isoform X3 [Cyphomyrmex costatus]|uniref:renin receptor isoform X3 n=1 Tax=Cyphomyrmex costatus TaxID=456900 RepID=UPI000852234B|nr:PREDICTED: renin receptor isoform X3 [Cyphomyrmex costatus]
MMFPQLSVFFAILAAVHANGEFLILHAPDSIQFTKNGEIEQSSLKEILSMVLGYTPGKQRDSEYNIIISNPFSLPKALVAIVFEGVEKLPYLKDNAEATYPLISDEGEETCWQAIRSRVEERSNDNTLVRINLSDGVDALGQSALGELKPTKMEKLDFLNLEIEEDRKFVEEMQLLCAIGDNAFSAKKHDSGTDVYWLIVSTLRSLWDRHENNSTVKEEAYKLLNRVIEHVSKGFVNTYDGKIVIASFTNDAWKARNARSVLERKRRDTPADKTKNVKSTAKGAPISSDINDNFFIKPEFSGRAKVYTENYPVIFNIILWFGVVFVFSLLAICIAIANMDPGRDSIIYRMTSNRMKKDN